MKLGRLVLESGDRSVSLDLDPRLTVISGVGPLEREGLVSELIGALGQHRSGVHLELELDDGSQLAVFRPDGGEHRVVSVEHGLDVSAAFATADGGVDLLGRVGLDAGDARRLMRCTAQDLATSTRHDEIVRRLASLDQDDLWETAENVTRAAAELRTTAEATGGEPEDVEAVEVIESRHAHLVQAQDDHERIRRLSFFVATVATLGAVPLAIIEGTQITMPFLLFACVATAMSLVFWARVRSAQTAEEAALEDAGAESYLGFHLERVNNLLANDRARRQLMDTAETHRRAEESWTHLTGGEMSAEWALQHRLEIGAASQLHQEVVATASPSDGNPAVATELVTRLAQALASRLKAVSSVGEDRIALPLILDEAFDGLDDHIKARLLEMLLGATEQVQVVFLTNDADVVSWARLEAMTGALQVVEPVAEEADGAGDERSAETSDPSLPRRRPHHDTVSP